MEVPSKEDEMPVPLTTRMIHQIPTAHNHNIVIPAYSCPQIIPSNSQIIFKYKECMKNHAIAVGGNATDGCGEFLPDGEEGTIEALSCSACNCHRNFHRKEIAADAENYCCRLDEYNPRNGGKVSFLGHQRNALEYQAGTLVSSTTFARQMGGGAAAGPSQVVKKRFRTKFTQEQKEKMQDFAEKVGWKIQKLEEYAVQSFCQEVGVEKRVLRVWMHNNKHNFTKKNISQPNGEKLNLQVSETN
ncbi:Homeobox protein 31 [Dorcoceras hygrometricum]|uniref:Homeobox protein 31 n=1 Tax=Dorcoceras hygrometricum TaxID=472368 RepID=A0A2Z7CTL8_9LAMI|nr:Homeobox protein 31 [Dorcoceras hygrometricum]